MKRTSHWRPEFKPALPEYNPGAMGAAWKTIRDDFRYGPFRYIYDDNRGDKALIKTIEERVIQARHTPAGQRELAQYQKVACQRLMIRQMVLELERSLDFADPAAAKAAFTHSARTVVRHITEAGGQRQQPDADIRAYAIRTMGLIDEGAENFLTDLEYKMLVEQLKSIYEARGR